ncbi:ATP-binding protein [Sulfolobus tengchongensis]|uniref:ATP-binding protein n=1 Tax=Sulfolobus tengchongensis TaxID=207809 RepID=A0AAX4L4X7_9CREN
MACDVFDPYPKNSRESFYDREDTLNEVKKLIQGKFWPLIIGPKRVGKTSIVKIVVNELNGVYIDASGITSLKQLASSLYNEIKFRFQIDLKVLKVDIDKKPTFSLQNILTKLGDVVIGIDEVQNITTPWFISVLSTAYNTSDVKFIFTGSMIGLSKVLVGESKGKKFSNQFKGRPIVEKEISPFSYEESVSFLAYGKERCSINMTEEEIKDSAETYQGIVGWLTYYGNLRSLGYDHKKAKEEVDNIASRIILDEYARLGEIEKVIVKALGLLKSSNWNNLKKVCEGLLGKKISDWNFDHSLKQLIKARIIYKKDGKYFLIDPMYKVLIRD